MTKGTKIFMGICAIVLVCVMGVGAFTRSSYRGSTTIRKLEDNNNIDGYAVQIFERDEIDSQFVLFANVDSYTDLEQNSSFIAKVKVTDDRKLYRNTVNTRVVLEEIYKSDGKQQINDSIYIYEPADFEEEFEIYDSIDGYQLMESGAEYYVFLNELKAAPGYKKSKKEQSTFVPSTTKFSVYSINDQEQSILAQEKMYGEEDRYSYGEIKNLCILTSEQSELDQYKEIRATFMKKTNNKKAF